MAISQTGPGNVFWLIIYKTGLLRVDSSVVFGSTWQELIIQGITSSRNGNVCQQQSLKSTTSSPENHTTQLLWKKIVFRESF